MVFFSDNVVPTDQDPSLKIILILLFLFILLQPFSSPSPPLPYQQQPLLRACSLDSYCYCLSHF